MKKSMLLTLFLILLPSVTASILLEGDVNDRETFKAGDHYFYVQYVSSTQGAIFKMDDMGGIMLPGECGTRENIKYCYLGANYPLINVKIESLEPDISIERTFSTTTPFLNEKITVTVILTNNGDKGATNIKYTDPYPISLKIFSDKNAGEWEGRLSAGEEEKFTYTIRADDITSFDSTATLSYTFDGKKKTKESAVETIEVKKPFTLSHEISKEAADKNEIVNYNLTISNNDESSRMTIDNLEIVFPSKVDIVTASSQLKKEGNKLTFKGTIEKRESKNFAVKVKSSQVGKFTIKASAEVKLGGRDFKEDLEKLLSVGLSYILPILNVTDSVKSNSPYKVYIAVKNYGDNEIKDVAVKAESDLFTNIEEKKNIAAGITVKLLDKTLTAPYLEEDKKYNIKVSGSYVSSTGRTYTFEKSAQLAVKAVPKIVKIIREFNKEEFYLGDEIKVTVKVKNLKNTAVEQIDISDIFPKEIRPSLMGDVIGELDKLGPNEEKKAYSYSLVVPDDYKEDEIEFKTNLNTKVDGELVILKRTDKVKILKGEKSEGVEEEQEMKAEEEEKLEDKDISKEEETPEEKTEEIKEGFFKKIISWVKGLFNKNK